MRPFFDRSLLPGDRPRAGAILPYPPDPRGANLEVRALSLAYGTSVVVREVTLEAKPGQVICVMGRNGAGKTTLLNGIIGVHPTPAGTVFLDGGDASRRRSYERARAGMGYVPQGRRIFPQLSVTENLLMGLAAAGGRDRGQLDEVYALFPVLKEMGRRSAGVLSGGQQQQLAIGRALMGRPRLLLLDEPTEGIQPSIVEQIEAVIGSLRGTMTIVLVEQFLEFALANADHCYVLGAGSVVLAGAPGDLDADLLRGHLSV
jgi:urea transport system ATP-binding protein